MIAEHMRIIVDILIKYCPRIQSVMLAGGFGRREGSVLFLPSNKVTPLGDYDLFVVTDSRCDARRISEAADDIRKRIGVTNDFGVDVEVIPRGKLQYLNPDISTYELKVASKVLYGEDYRNLISFGKDDIAVSSGFITLSIRTMMLSKVLEKIRKGNLSYEDRVWCVYQCCKAFTEICTALSLVEGFYEPSYEERATLFAQYFPNMKGLKDKVPDLPEKVREYTLMKLSSKFDEKTPMEALVEASRYLEVSFLYFMTKYLGVNFEETTWRQNTEKMYNGLQTQFLRSYLHPILEKKKRWFKPLIGFLVLVGQLYENFIYAKQIYKAKGVIYPQPLLHLCSPLAKSFIAANLAFYAIDVSTMKIDTALLKKANEYLLRVYPHDLPCTTDWSDWQTWKSITKLCGRSQKLYSASHQKKSI